MPELEAELTALAAAIEWPGTPPRLWVGVSPRLMARANGPRWQMRLPLAAVAVLAIVATLLAYSPTRDAVATWLNLHTAFQRTEHPPTPSPLPSGSTGQRLNLGVQTTFDGAQRQVGWQILVPASLGTPDEVYLKQPPLGPSGGMVTLVYKHRPGLQASSTTGAAVLVTEARGMLNEAYFDKMLGTGTTVEHISVNGHAGYWISGPHDFFFSAADGTIYWDTLRLATDTLAFDHSGTLIRIEGNLTRDQALEIARSVT